MDDQEVASGTADAGGNLALRASLWRLIQISGQYTLFLYEAGESGFVLIGQQSFKVNLTLQIRAQIDAKFIDFDLCVSADALLGEIKRRLTRACLSL